MERIWLLLHTNVAICYQHDGHSSFHGFCEFEMYSTTSGTKLIKVTLNSYELATC